ncbi:hypothetical protein [Bilophila wadsworthia]|uniref:hypothetical protein n=1 Tax=Bilophila wadsworthia TaxID=35833 RepID=UPI0026709F6B|nr:hypothetical protein [Bilophila wadsworthia]
MGFLTSFLISLAVSLVFSVISMLLFPVKNSSSNVAAGELEPPSASEGIPIPHVRGTRFVSPNCLWWTPTGNTPIKK